jgi:uncharacterized membrane protein
MENPETGGTAFLYTKGRVETLTDGIFAVAMTLLVVTIDVPSLKGDVTPGVVDSIITGLLPDAVHYFIAFALLVAFWWSSHKRCHFITSMDRNYILLDITTLAFVAIVPFSTNLIGNFPFDDHAALLFETNIFLIGLFSTLQWKNVSNRKEYLIDGADYPRIIRNLNKSYILPSLSAAGMVIAMLGIPGSAAVYIAAPPLFWLVHRHSCRNG